MNITLLGETVDSAPTCPGIYRFLGAQGDVLYIGKSINIRNRLSSHFAPSGNTDRKKRLLSAATRVDCQPTSGEAGALLLENAAIKRELPLFNRRQRSLKRLWAITLEECSGSYLQPQATCFNESNPNLHSAFGCYASRFHAREALHTVAREASLCPRILGLERGSGACFQRQIGRCLGACEGEETAASHNDRLLASLASRRMMVWPIARPVLLFERAPEPEPWQPAEQWHLLHNWVYIGTYGSPEEARYDADAAGVMFDRDTYRILRGVLRQDTLKLYCLQTMAPVVWPDSDQTR